MVTTLAIASLWGVVGCGGPSEESPVERARTSLLTGRYFPEDWKRLPQLKVRGCGARPFRDAVAVRSAHFAGGVGDARQLVVVFASEKAAARAYAELESRRLLACFRSGAERGMERYLGGKVLEPLATLERKDLGEGVRAMQMVAEVESPIGPAKVYIDRIECEKDQLVMQLFLTSGLTPVSGKFYEKVVAAALRRGCGEAGSLR